MSARNGVTDPLYVRSDQVGPQNPSAVMQGSYSGFARPLNREYSWSANLRPAAQNINQDHTSYSMQQLQDSPMLSGGHYSTTLPEDKDEFLTFGTCTSVRGEQLAFEPVRQSCTLRTGATLGNSEMDDTLMHGQLTDEEEVESALLNHNFAEDSLPPSRLAELENRNRQLVQHLEWLQREYVKLQEINKTIESEKANSAPINGDRGDGDGDIEEIIEEEVHTVKHGQPSTEKKVKESVAHRVETGAQSEKPHFRSVGVGNLDIRRYFMVDMGAKSIEKSHFPAEYWSRLEELFRARALAERPATREIGLQLPLIGRRTASTMATPSVAPKERLCFGVSVRPSTVEIGVMPDLVPTREFGCMTIESDAMIQEWLDIRLTKTNEGIRRTMKKLIKASLTNREEFVSEMLRLLKKDQRTVGLQAQPQYRSQFSVVDLENEAEHAPVKTEDQMIEARPLLASVSILARPVLGTSTASETESPLLRSQGVQMSPDIADTTDFGTQTGLGVHYVDAAVSPICTERRHIGVGIQTVVGVYEPSVLYPTSSPTTLRAYTTKSSSPVRDDITVLKTDERSDVFAVDRPILEKSRLEIIQRSRSAEPTSSTRLGFETVAATTAATGSSIKVTYSQAAESIPTSSIHSSPTYKRKSTGSSISGYVVSSERRVVDELTESRLLPSDISVDELKRGGRATLDEALSRATDLGSTQVVHEFQPSVEVLHHVDSEQPGFLTSPYPSSLSPDFILSPTMTPADINVTEATAQTSTSGTIPVHHLSPSPTFSSQVSEQRDLNIIKRGSSQLQSIETKSSKSTVSSRKTETSSERSEHTTSSLSDRDDVGTVKGIKETAKATMVTYGIPIPPPRPSSSLSSESSERREVRVTKLPATSHPIIDDVTATTNTTTKITTVSSAHKAESISDHFIKADESWVQPDIVYDVKVDEAKTILASDATAIVAGGKMAAVSSDFVRPIPTSESSEYQNILTSKTESEFLFGDSLKDSRSSLDTATIAGGTRATTVFSSYAVPIPTTRSLEYQSISTTKITSEFRSGDSKITFLTSSSKDIQPPLDTSTTAGGAKATTIFSSSAGPTPTTGPSEYQSISTTKTTSEVCFADSKITSLDFPSKNTSSSHEDSRKYSKISLRSGFGGGERERKVTDRDFGASTWESGVAGQSSKVVVSTAQSFHSLSFSVGHKTDVVRALLGSQQTSSGTAHVSTAKHIPARNYKYVLSSDVREACATLGWYYKSGEKIEGDTVDEQLTKLRRVWFELTSPSNVQIEVLQDFVAILYEYDPILLREVVRSVDENGGTCLHYAVGHGAWSVVNLILDSGYGEPDRFNKAGFSPVMIATLKKTSDSSAISTMDRLFSMGNVNLHSNTPTRQTPLMLAASNGADETVNLLLRHGALVNLQDASGNTAIMFAIEHGDLSMVNTLLSLADLDLSLQDNEGKTALVIAQSRGNAQIVEAVQKRLQRTTDTDSDVVSTWKGHRL
ncbi:unnamed protein product [Calicophoron daubneyi]|uniref:Uncharacterized protein n=1 Tax=Calicophoron daubneyi TaxID=300641 RepID=A0AAV2TQ80_CALDB